jgi:hypothetical protein
MINKLLSIITEGEGKREGKGLPNCCRWKSTGRRGPGGGGGAWSRWWFPGMAVKVEWTAWFPDTAVKVGRMTRFPGAAVKTGRMTRFPGALSWRSEVSAWRRSQTLHKNYQRPSLHMNYQRPSLMWLCPLLLWLCSSLL